MVANPARGQLNKENRIFPVPVRAWEFGLASYGSAVPSRVSLLILHTQAESGAYLRDPTPPFPLSATVSIRTVMRHRASAEFIRLRNCVPMAFATGNRPAQGQQFSKVAR